MSDDPIQNFKKSGTKHRIMTLVEYKSNRVHLPAHEVFSTIAISPQVRRAIFRLMELRPGSVIGDIESLKRNVPLVYKYIYRTDRYGNRLQGRPRKLVVEVP